MQTYHSTDTEGQISAIDLIEQFQHLPGIDLDGNHTISIRGLQSNDTGGHSSSPLVTIDVMLMNSDSVNMQQSEDAPGFTFIALSIASAIALFVNKRKEQAASIYENKPEK